MLRLLCLCVLICCWPLLLCTMLPTSFFLLDEIEFWKCKMFIFFDKSDFSKIYDSIVFMFFKNSFRTQPSPRQLSPRSRWPLPLLRKLLQGHARPRWAHSCHCWCWRRAETNRSGTAPWSLAAEVPRPAHSEQEELPKPAHSETSLPNAVILSYRKWLNMKDDLGGYLAAILGNWSSKCWLHKNLHLAIRVRVKNAYMNMISNFQL